MSAERSVVSPEVSGVHRLEVVPEIAPAITDRTSLRTIEVPGRTPAAPGITDATPTDINAPELQLNRELTYLNFCWRVLQEADDVGVPLLERLKFIAIISSNIDEFFQKRLGGLKQQVGAQVHVISPDGRTPQQQIVDCLELISRLEKHKAVLLERVLTDLRGSGVWIASYRELDAKEQAWVREHYLRNIFPLVTPQAMDPAHPFPFVSNLSLNLLVSLRYENDVDGLLARVKVPVGGGTSRFLRIGTSRTFVDLSDVIANNLDLLFPGWRSRRARCSG